MGLKQSKQDKPIQTHRTVYFENGSIKCEEWRTDRFFHRDGDEPALIEYYEDGRFKSKQWFNYGQRHREFHPNNPAIIEYYQNGNLKSQKWCKNGYGHRDDEGPSIIEYYDNNTLRSQKWYQNGKAHRGQIPSGNLDLPALVEYYENGKIKAHGWYQNGKCHRKVYTLNKDKPAFVTYYTNGKIKSQGWYQNGKAHRENGPALIKNKYHVKYSHESRDKRTSKIIEEFVFCQGGVYRVEAWYKHGKLHNSNGPAYIRYQNEVKILEFWFKNGKRYNKFGFKSLDYFPNGQVKEKILTVN